MGVSERTSSAHLGFQCPLADELADALSDDHRAHARRRRRFARHPAACSLHGAAAPAFAPPEPVEEPPGFEAIGRDGAWPGTWTVLRDEVHQRSTVVWEGTAAVSYPWGRFDHSERLTYDVDDAHPDIARVQGDSEYVQAVKDHTLTWRGRLDVSSDAHTFFYKYTRTLLRDGVLIRTKSWEEPIPRDHQ